MNTISFLGVRSPWAIGRGHTNGHIKKNLYALQAGNKYYLTAGIEYSNEAYVWIAQSEITATPSGAVSH